MNQEEFLKKLEIELKISKNSPYTVRNYINANKELLDHFDKYPQDITSDDIKLFLSEKYSDKATSSIIMFLAAVKYAFTLNFDEDITRQIKRPKKEKILPSVLTKEETKILLNSLSNQKSKLMISLIYACGFRVSELINLKVKDLDFDEKIGIIKRSKGKKDRFFNIPDFLCEDLINQMEKQEHKR